MSKEKRWVTHDEVSRMLVGGERLGPGVWVDREGALHFSVPELLKHFRVEDTPANRERMTAIISDWLAEAHPTASIIETEEYTN